MTIVTVNHYIVTMTNWTPALQGRPGPRYVAIAEALADDIESGALAAGQRLPTHRDLAWRIGVTVGTVTRAYAQAAHRGLIAGEVGRGTFVREAVPLGLPEPKAGGTGSDLIDLSYNFPTNQPGDSVAEIVAELNAEGSLSRFMAYEVSRGHPHHRAAGAAWITESGLPTDPGQVVVTAGAQHGMLLAVAALARPGDVVLTEELTYYGIKSIASLLDLRLHGVAMDEQGLLPTALEAACRSTGAKALYCTPTLQNPTAANMPKARRREIAEICVRHQVGIIEDDIYGFLPERPSPPLSGFAPDLSVYVTSLSKCVAPGLRIGFVRAEEPIVERIGNALRASTLMAPPLMAEVATRLIRNGRARQVANWQREEAKVRQTAAKALLAGADFVTQPESYHLWLKLPEPWRREVFTAEARARGVGVAPAEVFAVGRQSVPHAVRVCLQAARSRGEVEKALAILSEILAGAPRSHLPLV